MKNEAMDLRNQAHEALNLLASETGDLSECFNALILTVADFSDVTTSMMEENDPAEAGNIAAQFEIVIRELRKLKKQAAAGAV